MMSAKGRSRGLGRGLDALFADRESVRRPEEETVLSAEEETADGNAVHYIGINDIKPNSGQPRKNFNKEKIDELAASIVEHGIIQPLVVRKAVRGYEIVAGERRWRAARVADLKEVPCLIRDFTDEENMLVAIIENMQREDLDPIEEAEGLEKMISVYGLTQTEVSKGVSKSRPYITNSLRLLNLPQEIRSRVSEGLLSAGHARAILSAGSEARQFELAERVIKDGLSVRETERLASRGPKKRGRPAKRAKSRDIVSIEGELKDLFGTKVNIETKGSGGAIEFEYYSSEELNRLIDIFRTARG
mgnify:CR=1 FL=1